MKPRTRRIVSGVAMILLAMIIGLGIAGWSMLRSSIPPTSGTVTLSGPRAAVNITFDSLGIPQIWAADEHDALFALGWQHAADRMFQMDLIRRVSQGRLSQMLGDVVLDLDIQQRRIGHGRLARKAMETLSDTSRARLQAYADGINAYLEKGGSVPFEFRLLPVSFDRWTVYDCLTILSFESWFSDALQNSDRFYMELAQQGYADAVRTLPLDYPTWGLNTVSRDLAKSQSRLDTIPAPLEPAARVRYELAKEILRVGPGAFSGFTASNAWVVAPQKSAGGKAMLASDPHLEITRLPQFWYIAGLHTADGSLDAVGITIAGLPFVIMGHNQQAAWAFTAGGVDITDYYTEQLDPQDSTRYLLQLDSAAGITTPVWDTLQVIHDSIPFAGSDTLAHATYRITQRGPIVPELSNDSTVVTERWAGTDTDFDKAIGAGFDLMRSDRFQSFRAAVTSLGALNANWMYADSSGTIGYQLGTPIPIRGNAEHRLALSGAKTSLGWQGYEPPDNTPHAENPPDGWLASANNRPGANQDIPGTYAADRIMRLTELLQSKDQFTVADMQRFQMDRHDSYLLRWKPDLLHLIESIPDTTGAAEALAAWDGSTDSASYATAIVVTFVKKLGEAIFNDELGKEAAQHGKYVIDAVYHDSLSPWIDDITTEDSVETRDQIGRLALERALSTVMGRPWGQLQSLSMQHPMAMVPVVTTLLGLEHGPWSWGGTASTLNAAYSRPARGGTFECIVGPSWRFVIDFADIDGATMVIPGGISGNPMSPHFFDFDPYWRTGGRWNVPLGQERVQSRAASTLTLVPDTSVVGEP